MIVWDKVVPIVPNDNQDLPDGITFKILFSQAPTGATPTTLRVTLADGQIINFNIANAANIYLYNTLGLQIRRVHATGTNILNMYACYEMREV